MKAALWRSLSESPCGSGRRAIHGTVNISLTCCKFRTFWCILLFVCVCVCVCVHVCVCFCVCMSAYAPVSVLFFLFILCHFFPGPDLQVKVVIPPYSPNWVQLECHSMCHRTGFDGYTWYRDGTRRHQGRLTWFNINSEYRSSCAVQGSEHLPSPSVCKSATVHRG